MDLWGFLRRLGIGSEERPRESARKQPLTTADAGQPVAENSLEVLAHLLWGNPWDKDPRWSYGRALYTTLPEHSHDVLFLGRLFSRLGELWSRRQPQTQAEATLLAQIEGAYVPNQRVQVPPAFCGCESVYLHDVDWRSEEVGPDLEAGEFNRSLRRLLLTPGKAAVFQPAQPGDVERRVRARLRALRVRGSAVVPAFRVQANYTMYEPGDNDGPAVVLFSLSPDPNVEALNALADELFAARDDEIPTAPGLEDAVALLQSNVHHWIYHRRARVNRPSEGNDPVYVADIWLHRPFLREGRIVRAQGRELRCLVEPGDEGGIELLPWESEPGPCVAANPAWLRWNESCVVKLAQNIAEQRDFAQLPILADALEEAGCTSAEMLNHCRRPQAHSGRCWVVDLLLDSV